MMKRNLIIFPGIVCLCVTSAAPVFARTVYQDFEPQNGTPKAPASELGSPPEYGWGFNGVRGSLSSGVDPVHTGVNAWKSIIPPSGKPVHAGVGIPSQTQTYDMDFVPECHDRLTFWIWSDPSEISDHTVLVKFFDQNKYKHKGIGIWTGDKANYREWTQLKILFSLLPSDFDFAHVDKIEFFNYWDGTYYYDDIETASSFSPERDLVCLERGPEVVDTLMEEAQQKENITSQGRSPAFDKAKFKNDHARIKTNQRMKSLIQLSDDMVQGEKHKE